MQVHTYPRTRVSLFGSPSSHTLGARGKNMQIFAYGQLQTAGIWTLGHKSKKLTYVDAYVDGEYCAQILANLIMNCRTSRVLKSKNMQNFGRGSAEAAA